MKLKLALAAGVAAAVAATSALALVTFDPATGLGFVGKGDVQLIFGWNNAQLQTNVSNVKFRVNSVTVSEVTWECTKFAANGNEIIQERQQTTTTSLQGIVSSVARERNQITGFNLTGFSGTPTTSTVTDGPALDTCANANSGFVLTTPAGEPVVLSSTGGLEVTKDGLNYLPIQ